MSVEIKSPALEEGTSRIARLPELSDIVSLSKSEQLLLMERFQILDPADKAALDQISKAQRLHRLSKDQAQLEIEAIADKYSTSQLRKATKETMRSWSIANTVDDENALYMWVGEGDVKMCDNCAAMEGEIMTYKEFLANGTIPGPSVCLGGEDCRCSFALVSN